ncbi:hypothetical protein R5R35_001586 [Gryllus longicercus]|uniref:Pickpocket n=1 Tax=Gryllus longicercus TaxID=2509291 RepID=A0AAN9WG83_9ORTH
MTTINEHAACADNFQKVDFRVGKRKLGLDVESRSSEPSGERERCRCLPSCVYYGYEASASVFESKGAHWISDVRKGLCTNETYEETTSLESKVYVYFDNFYLIPLRRMERFGTIDFLANCGGLLGLCLGVSALSVVEFFYWLLIRPWYGNRKLNQSIPSL